MISEGEVEPLGRGKDLPPFPEFLLRLQFAPSASLRRRVSRKRSAVCLFLDLATSSVHTSRKCGGAPQVFLDATSGRLQKPSDETPAKRVKIRSLDLAPSARKIAARNSWITVSLMRFETLALCTPLCAAKSKGTADFWSRQPVVSTVESNVCIERLELEFRSQKVESFEVFTNGKVAVSKGWQAQKRGIQCWFEKALSFCMMRTHLFGWHPLTCKAGADKHAPEKMFHLVGHGHCSIRFETHLLEAFVFKLQHIESIKAIRYSLSEA